MNNGLYASFSEIKERLARDYGFENMANDDELKEWIFSAMRLIGANSAFILKVMDGEEGNDDPIKVTDYKGKLPNDMIYPLLARDYDTKTPMICKTSPFRTFLLPDIPWDDSAWTYSMNNKYIFTDIEELSIEFAYLAFPVDEQKDPMVPDNEHYIRAVVSFLAERIAHRLNIKDMLTDKKYDKLLQDWQYNATEAKVKLESPTIDQMEGLKNQWISLIPKTNMHDSSFRNLGNRNGINTINRRR